MRSCVLGVCVTIVLFFPPYFSDSIPEDTQSRQTAWFVVSESDRSELYLEPLAKNVDGHLVPVSNSCIPTDPGHKKLVIENFEAGRRAICRKRRIQRKQGGTPRLKLGKAQSDSGWTKWIGHH